MNRRQHRQQRPTRTRSGTSGLVRGFGLLALSAASCLPTDNLSEYSKGGLLSAPDEASLNGSDEETPSAQAPGDGVAEGAPGDGVAADGVLADGAPPLSTGTV